MSKDTQDFELADLTSAVEGQNSVGIGNYSGAVLYCDLGLCVVGWT